MKFNRKIVMALCLALITCMTLQLILPVYSVWCNSARAASKILLNKTKATLTVGKTLQLKVSGTTNKVTWLSSNKKIATVTKKGKVTAKKVGKAIITAKVGKKKLTCKITVKKKKEQKEQEEINFKIECDLPKPVLAKDQTWTTVREYEITGFDYDIIPTSGGFKCKLYFAGIKTKDASGDNHYSRCPIVYRLFVNGSEINHLIKGPSVRVGESWSLSSCTWVTEEIKGNPSQGRLTIDKYPFE